MGLIDTIHARHVYARRACVLSTRLAGVLPADARVLDVGTGEGYVASLIAARRPDLEMTGVEVLMRSTAHIPIIPFDGRHLPFADGEFDVVMFVDVLHHTNDPLALLHEAARVAGSAIVIKDHTLTGCLAETTLRVMDWVGNARHGVALPYNYWKKERWCEAIAAIGGNIESWQDRLGLYWGPASLLFDRSLHFIASVGLSGRHAEPVRKNTASLPTAAPADRPETLNLQSL